MLAVPHKTYQMSPFYYLFKGLLSNERFIVLLKFCCRVKGLSVYKFYCRAKVYCSVKSFLSC